MKQTRPEEINLELVASLRLAFGSQIAIEEKLNKSFDVIGIACAFNCDVPDDWKNAISFFAKPAKGDDIAIEVTRLRSLTAKRAEGDFDLELSIGALTEELGVYPIDIVKTVCRDFARQNKWFPTLKDLIDKCEEPMILRRALIAAVNHPKQIGKI